MPRHAKRPAAYTRTGVLRKFLDQAEKSLPSQIDQAYVGDRLGLNGGDVRAFLGSLELLGLIDLSGRPTTRLEQTRAPSRRYAVLREGLRDAYPDLVERWEAAGGLTRQAVEEHFRIEHGLGDGSAAAAAKLFMDLWLRERQERPSSGMVEAASKGGEAGSASAENGSRCTIPRLDATIAKGDQEEHWQRRERGAQMQMLTGLVQSMIEKDWDAEGIRLVLEGLERLLSGPQV